MAATEIVVLGKERLRDEPKERLRGGLTVTLLRLFLLKFIAALSTKFHGSASYRYR